ncbi:MAG: type II and III secretion system protein family protein [Hyphomicrobiales bacterium]
MRYDKSLVRRLLSEREQGAEPKRPVRWGLARKVASLMCCLLLAGAVGVQPAPWGGEAEAASAKVYRLSKDKQAGRLRVTLRKSETIEVDIPFAEVLIGDPAVADVLPLTNHSIYVLGKEVGSTNISIYDKDKQLLGVLDLEIAYDAKGLARTLSQNITGGKIKVSSVNGRLLLSGTVLDAPSLTRALNLANQYAPDAVTNALSVGTSQQVMLEVRFVEVERTAGRELGVKWDVVSKRFSAMTGTGLLTSTTPFGTIIGTLLSGGVDADIIIEALEEKGLARRLAEPNLVALSGDTASFLAGGEFPFPTGADKDEIRIEFKKFGVGLSFTPTVLADGLINMEIEPEVSQLDPTTTLRLASIEIPSLVVRRAHTTVELRDGQSFAIAGLLQSNHSKARQQLPWIGQVPVLGALFSSTSYQKEETDLVIIVTPRLVRPASPDERLVTPLDKSRPGNDVDLFLFGDMEVPNDVVDYFKAGGNKQGPYGHIIPSGTERVRAYPIGGREDSKATQYGFLGGTGARRYNDK